MTIKEYLTDWHNSREVLLKTSTFEAEGIYLQRHIIPFFDEFARAGRPKAHHDTELLAHQIKGRQNGRTKRRTFVGIGS